MIKTIKDFAKLLDKREYREEITKEEEALAKELGFIVVFGASDDLVEFRGFINDERDCYSGGKVYLDKNGIFEGCECRCKYSELVKENCKTIEAFWYKEDVAWTYETSIPHETFNVLEDSEVYCRGIIFKIEDLYD